MKRYATKGFFVVNVNYGLCPECVFPEQIRHLVSAINWIKKNEKKFNLDLKKMVVSGDSAGAYFSAMLACVCESKVLQRRLKVETDIHFSAAILNCGLYDLDSILTRKFAFGLNDMDGISHRGFECFFNLLEKYKPRFFIHGHVHLNYDCKKPRVSKYGVTTVINAYEFYKLDY